MKRIGGKFLLLGVTLGLCFLFTLGICLSVLVRAAEHTPTMTIVLDAGHGGVDGGVTGVKTGVKESEINLCIVKELQIVLEQAGLNVVLTRKTDAGLYSFAVKGFKKQDMLKRKEIISRAAPIAVISVHQNSFPSAPSRRGGQVFYRAGSEESESLANLIQQELNAMPECVKKTTPLAGDYYILNCTEYASVICECGFLSNAEDETLLTDGEYRQKIAAAVGRGVLSYLAHATLRR